MARRESFVAKDTADLIHTLESADQQPLQMQLQRDAEEHIAVERIVVRLKRTRVAAAGNLLQHGGLDIDEATLIEQATNGGDDLRTGSKNGAHLGIGDQVHVPLPVANLHVLQAMPFLGQRAQRFRQQPKRMHFERDLAPFGAENGPRDANDVTEVEVGEPRELLLAEEVAVGHQLDPAMPVLQVCEDQSALLPLDHQAAGDRNGFGPLGLAEERFRGFSGVSRLESPRVWVDAGCAQTVHFFEPLAHELFRHDRKRLIAKGRAPAPQPPEMSSHRRRPRPGDCQVPAR